MMTERQTRILHALIREYVRTAEPVGSEFLVERYRLPYSPATVRAEFSGLEEQELLSHPHTSAGRVPTDRGYRHLLNEQTGAYQVSAADLRRLEQDVRALLTQQRQVARGAAKILAALSHHLAVAGVADREEVYEAGLPDLLREPEFSRTDHVLDVSRLLEIMDERFAELTAEPTEIPQVYIGEENPFLRPCRVSMLFTTVDFPSGERGLLVIIGPTRMRYGRNLGILAEAARLLETAGEEK